jgi:hypothetical protein
MNNQHLASSKECVMAHPFLVTLQMTRKSGFLHTSGDTRLHGILKESICWANEEYETSSLTNEALMASLQNDWSVFYSNRCGNVPNGQENSII